MKSLLSIVSPNPAAAQIPDPVFPGLSSTSGPSELFKVGHADGPLGNLLTFFVHSSTFPKKEKAFCSENGSANWS
jgi:hypothetical protein